MEDEAIELIQGVNRRLEGNRKVLRAQGWAGQLAVLALGAGPS